MGRLHPDTNTSLPFGYWKRKWKLSLYRGNIGQNPTIEQTPGTFPGNDGRAAPEACPDCPETSEPARTPKLSFVPQSLDP